jgi:hydrogenase-4 component B
MQIAIALWGVGVLLATGVAAALLQRSRLAAVVTYGASLFACLGMLGASCQYLLAAAASTQSLQLPLGLPWTGAHFRLDALAAFFLLVVNLGGASTSLFALGQAHHEPAPGRVLPFYPLFVAGMNLVVLADDAFGFLLAWEFMSVTSWALVLAHHRDPSNRRAGYIYILMASFGTLALLLAFGLLAGTTGSYTFADIRSGSGSLSGFVLILALLGAGSKAGLVPLHVWLPLAHPAAPSHVSALMSGVMTKVAVYGFIRIAFQLNGPPAWWWSVLLIVLAAITCVLGVLSALMQHDLKRLLAYHTVENIGIIFLGLGLGLAFSSHGLPGPAALALTAALFHVFNHCLFKTLLFLGSGAVLGATGERDMEHLGGLIHSMPLTAFAFLTGCLAISALPPLNGFVSEWLTFQAILLSPTLPSWALKLIIPAAGALLALSAALAAACFVKAFGVTFLGRPRTDAAQQAKEVEPLTLAAMFALALLCLLAGVLPGFCIDALAPVIEGLTGTRMPQQSALAYLAIVPVAASRSSYNGLLIFLFIFVSTLLTIAVVHRFASRAIRRAPAWDCGFPLRSPRAQYTADSFAQPIRRVFGSVVFQAREHVEMPLPGERRPARLTVILRDPLWEAIYAPLAGAVALLAERLNHLQFLTIRQYLSLVFIALIGLLLVVSLWT